mmetsp:Transcript_82782/g.257135  ORF Transcript_82782/g.257135 Transcript_82782/m.257135 type:complete len:251 (+) Transcript_82782:220-972(+)
MRRVWKGTKGLLSSRNSSSARALATMALRWPSASKRRRSIARGAAGPGASSRSSAAGPYEKTDFCGTPPRRSATRRSGPQYEATRPWRSPPAARWYQDNAAVTASSTLPSAYSRSTSASSPTVPAAQKSTRSAACARNPPTFTASTTSACSSSSWRSRRASRIETALCAAAPGAVGLSASASARAQRSRPSRARKASGEANPLESSSTCWYQGEIEAGLAPCSSNSFASARACRGARPASAGSAPADERP